MERLYRQDEELKIDKEGEIANNPKEEGHEIIVSPKDVLTLWAKWQTAGRYDAQIKNAKTEIERQTAQENFDKKSAQIIRLAKKITGEDFQKAAKEAYKEAKKSGKAEDGKEAKEEFIKSYITLGIRKTLAHLIKENKAEVEKLRNEFNGKQEADIFEKFFNALKSASNQHQPPENWVDGGSEDENRRDEEAQNIQNNGDDDGLGKWDDLIEDEDKKNNSKEEVVEDIPFVWIDEENAQKREKALQKEFEEFKQKEIDDFFKNTGISRERIEDMANRLKEVAQEEDKEKITPEALVMHLMHMMHKFTDEELKELGSAILLIKANKDNDLVDLQKEYDLIKTVAEGKFCWEGKIDKKEDNYEQKLRKRMLLLKERDLHIDENLQEIQKAQSLEDLYGKLDKMQFLYDVHGNFRAKYESDKLIENIKKYYEGELVDKINKERDHRLKNFGYVWDIEAGVKRWIIAEFSSLDHYGLNTKLAELMVKELKEAKPELFAKQKEMTREATMEEVQDIVDDEDLVLGENEDELLGNGERPENPLASAILEAQEDLEQEEREWVETLAQAGEKFDSGRLTIKIETKVKPGESFLGYTQKANENERYKVFGPISGVEKNIGSSASGSKIGKYDWMDLADMSVSLQPRMITIEDQREVDLERGFWLFKWKERKTVRDLDRVSDTIKTAGLSGKDENQELSSLYINYQLDTKGFNDKRPNDVLIEFSMPSDLAKKIFSRFEKSEISIEEFLFYFPETADLLKVSPRLAKRGGIALFELTYEDDMSRKKPGPKKILK